MRKEVCGPCTKYINIGQSILECEICFVPIHTKCYKKANFASKNGTWTCGTCANNILPRYNPFPCSAPSVDDDKFYDDEGAFEDTVIQSISRVLDSCKPYTVQDLNKITRQLNNHPENTIQFSSYFLNIDGNKTNFDSFCIELKRIEHIFPVIGLAETNVDPELKNLYQIPGYNSFYQSVISHKSKGTGVALYVHENFNAVIMEEFSFCNDDIETLFVKISQPSSSMTLVTGVIYRSPSGNETNFLHKFENICNILPQSGVRILGDYNFDFLQMKSNTNRASQFEDHFLSNALAPVISIPTHKRYNCQPSCIDNILTNDTDKIMLSGTITDSIGEHMPVFELSHIYFENECKTAKQVKYYDYSNANLNKFITQLEIDLTTLTVSEDFSQFTNLFTSALDATCKLERPKMTKRTLQNNPWITDCIIQASVRKHELKDDWVKSIDKKTPGHCGDPILRKIFTDYRKVLNQVISSAKNSFSCHKVLENKNDRRKTWQIINELRGKTKPTIKPSFIIDNEKITNRRAISNEFNKYFNSIASKLNDTLSECKISDCNFNSFEDFLPPTISQSIYLEDCTPSELTTLIAELDNNKASDIPIRVIKKSSHIIAPFLAQYFNLNMKLGCFPDVLKTGKITPIYKKGNPEDIGNYRPVSTLPIFGKLFEKVIYQRIFSFAQSKNLINSNQFGFRKSHSTSHAINHSVKIIEDALHKKKHILGIFIDLSKAFDTIDHETLLVKLNRYGIRSNALNLIKSYLSRRTQYTEVLGAKSESLTVRYGVPQGSVLGPLLFLLYINDISRASELGTFIMFADDTNIFVEGQTAAEAYSKGNELLNMVQKYMLLNKLHINMSKCCYIHFKPKAPNCDLSNSSCNNSELYINQLPIKKVSETKFLGVTIDEHLSWESHITALRRKLNYASATLYRIRDSLPIHLRKDLYHTLYESHLSYCISVWGGCALYKTARLWVSQKQCIRLLFGDKEAFLDKFRTAARARPFANQLLGEDFYRLEHTKPLFKEHKILVLKNLYVYHTYMELFKILKLRDPMVIFEQFKISDRKPDLIISDFPAEHFISKSTKLWNTITPKLKLTDYSMKINTMKNNLKRLLLLLQNSNDPVTWTSEDFNIQRMSSL